MSKRVISLLIIVVTLVVGCAPKSAPVQEAIVMQTSADSMSYVMGLNIGRNLIGVDSLLNIEVVCEGLRDAYISKPKLRDEEARVAYLKYMNYDIYERVKKYEDKFLEDLRKADRKFVATSSGLTYKVHTLGDMKSTIRNNRDTVNICYRILNVGGEVVDTTYLLFKDTLRTAVGDMPRGVIEASKLIGRGGHIEAWVPSNLAYGSAGNDSLNIAPNTMLYYEIWLMKVKRR